MMRWMLVLSVAYAAMMGAAFADENSDDYLNSDTPTENTNDNKGDGGRGWAYDWGGGYVGVTGGYSMGSHDTLGVGGIDTGSNDLAGAVLGLYTGHNYQVTRFVFGTEMDFAKSYISGPFNLPGSLVACNAGAFKCETDVNWVGTFRGRAGVAIGDFLPYATAGIAVGGVNTSYSGPGLDTDVSGLGVGWVAGLGVEYAMMKNLIIRGEGLHYDLSDVTSHVLGTEVATDTQFSVVRVGASVKF